MMKINGPTCEGGHSQYDKYIHVAVTAHHGGRKRERQGEWRNEKSWDIGRHMPFSGDVSFTTKRKTERTGIESEKHLNESTGSMWSLKERRSETERES